MKRLLIIPFALTLLFAVPAVGFAESAIEIIDSESQEVTITVSGTRLYVAGALGQTLQVYNGAGVCVMSVRVDGVDRHYDLNLSKGCYIVKVGKTVRKVFVK